LNHSEIPRSTPLHSVASALGPKRKQGSTASEVGPFKALALNNPTPRTEDLYFKCINSTVDRYRVFLEEVRSNSLQLANCDFDSGKATKAAKYSLTDDTYAKLLAQLASRKFDQTTPELRDDILHLFRSIGSDRNEERRCPLAERTRGSRTVETGHATASSRGHPSKMTVVLVGIAELPLIHKWVSLVTADKRGKCECVFYGTDLFLRCL
jgi:hypothetical protein